jgi:hypothetical protein
MKKKTWPAARIAKVWLELSAGVLALASVIIALLIATAPLREGYMADMTVPVSIGRQAESLPIPRAMAAVLPLQMRDDPGHGHDLPEFRDPRLIKGFGELRMDTTNAALYYTWMLANLIVVVLALWIIWSLRGVVKSTLEGSPFCRSNARRLRVIGLIIAGAGVVWPLFQYYHAKAVMARAMVEGLPLAPALRFSSDSILAGLLVLVLAAVFSHGADLEDERSLTI